MQRDTIVNILSNLVPKTAQRVTHRTRKVLFFNWKHQKLNFSKRIFCCQVKKIAKKA